MARPLVVFASLLVASRLTAQDPTHPLDGLSAREHWIARDVLMASGKLDTTVKFLNVALREPPKSFVLGWKPGEPLPREAFVHLRQSNRGFEAVVDLVGKRLVDWRAVTERQYMASMDESDWVREAMVANPEVLQALKRRGITDLTVIDCSPANNGYLGTPEERDRRLAYVSCFDGHGAVSGWGAPIEGVQAVVDLQRKQILRVTDTGVRPPASLMGEHYAEAVGGVRHALPPIVVTQPNGPGFAVDHHQVSWDNWRFQFRVDQRRGLVLSQIRYADQGRERSVLYQASLSELFVPYMDPSAPWNYQGYYDLGTYPSIFGGIASTLEPGADCPSNAVYFSSFVGSPKGTPFERARTACLFEWLSDEPAWRHAREGVVESRNRRDLVLRMIMGAGNYDYLFDWVFMQDGTIRVELAATGMDQVKGASTRSAAEAKAGGAAEDRYGRFVAPYLIAPDHSHFFSFRLDFDIDGQANSLMVDRLETERQPAANPRRSLWRVNSVEARTEADAKRHSPMSAPEFWRIVNPSVRGAYGDPVGYLLEGHGAMTLLSDDDYMRQRSGFTDYTLWATPLAPTELFAAGDYPTGSLAGEGLPKWTQANRPIANTDIVLWYTLGFHHVPRPEDWPILSLERHGFELKPSGFFSRNPAIDLPR